MKNKANQKNNKNKKEKREYDKGEIFVKVMAGFLAFLMVLSIASTLIYSLVSLL